MTYDSVVRSENPDSWASQLKSAILLCVLPLVIGLWMALMYLLFVVMLPCYIAFSRLFWPFTHEKRIETMLDLDGHYDLVCPDCRSKLTPDEIEKKQQVHHNGDSMISIHQSAHCEQCNGSYQRIAFGKIWNEWNAVIVVESDTPAESR